MRLLTISWCNVFCKQILTNSILIFLWNVIQFAISRDQTQSKHPRIQRTTDLTKHLKENLFEHSIIRCNGLKILELKYTKIIRFTECEDFRILEFNNICNISFKKLSHMQKRVQRFSALKSLYLKFRKYANLVINDIKSNSMI